MTQPHLTNSRALLSVSDKTGLVAFAKELIELGIEILSTGGTYKKLQDNGIACIEVSDYTGFPEMMGGRLKTLHPKIHGGILGRRDIDGDIMQEHNITPIDLVVVNLYPFSSTIEKEDCTLAMAIENIDIGGPTLLRAAAKNHKQVGVLVDTNDYSSTIAELKAKGNLSEKTRFTLASKAFAHTAQYDTVIASYLAKLDPNQQQTPLPNQLNLSFSNKQSLRYGENQHQQAALYSNQKTQGTTASAKVLQGKALSYNNLADADMALECVKSFSQPACVIVKHANPCGVAIACDCLSAYEKAYATDPTSAFGGIIAFNRAIDAQSAKKMLSQQFVEVVIAPSVSEQALEVFAQKPNIRVLSCGKWSSQSAPALSLKSLAGGLLVQETDNQDISEKDLKIVSQRAPTPNELEDLIFAWKVANYVKSNAIVYAKKGQTQGIGAGQMSRIDSARIGVLKAQDAKLSLQGSVMASDAFFPFADSVEAAAKVGVRAIIQPGGSIRDEQIIQAADQADIAMLFTGMRHFRH